MNLLQAIEQRLPPGYAIERRLGTGATSWVYLASRSGGVDRLVVKVMRSGTIKPDTVARFLAEMQALRTLEHPRIVPMLDPGEAQGALFFTMPYIAGETLHGRLHTTGALPVTEALRIARDVADALDYAHAKGIVHRDVKPANILVRHDGGAHLMDFGFAHVSSLAAERAGGGRLVVVGTPDYMSPEQVTGKAADDWRGDLYSLACVMHEMLTGRPPFAGGSSRAVMRRRLTEPPPEIRSVRPEVPAAVAAIVHRNLALSPSDRFATAGALRTAIDAALANAAGAR